MPNQSSTDTEIVAAHLAGDRAALAVMYDRYGAGLFDTAASMLRNRHDAADAVQDVFVIAAERLDQLRDSSRLKPWLYAVLRNEVYRRTGKRARTVATDFSEPVAEMSLPIEPANDASNAEYRELTELVRNAAAGLDERDQMVLEFTIRQGLEGDDLAAALEANPSARLAWDAFPPSARKAMLWWVISAVKHYTRARRIETIVAKAAKGERAQG